MARPALTENSSREDDNKFRAVEKALPNLPPRSSYLFLELEL